ncbi:hypothetical protein L9F63_019923 [Diploptera punctata]|uniref:Uncharacterized protein n=1 Tax=Diploptera punctata TaxID=6984 RepID=A0AAD7ZTI1_DIPPU|nr:hypothetical protein L9F63_019923 [Diploptera punctata]
MVIILRGLCFLSGYELNIERNSDLLVSCALEATRAYFQSEGSVIFATQACESDKFPFLYESRVMSDDELNISTYMQEECIINKTIYVLDIAQYMEIYQNILKLRRSYEVESCRLNFTDDLEKNMLRELHNSKSWSVLIFPYNRVFEYPGRGDISGYIITIRIYEYYEMLEGVNRILTALRHYRMLKFSTLFIVLVSGKTGGLNVNHLIVLFVEFHILDVIILVYDETNEVVNFYTFNPYELPSGECGLIYEGILINKCYFDENGVVVLRNRTTDFEIIPNLDGCSVLLHGILNEPLTIENDAGDPDTISNQSVVFILFKYVLDVMKMSIHKRREQTEEIIEILELDLYADVYVSESEQFIRYYTTTFYWFLYKSEPYSRWSTILCVFSNYVWLCMFFCYFHYREFSTIYFTHIQLGIGIPDPKPIYLRIIFLGWLIYSFSINTIFQCFFTSYLLDPLYQHQIDTFKEIVEENYELIFTQYNFVFIDSEFNTTSYMKWITNGESSLLYLHDGVKRAVFIPQESVTYFYNKICDGNVRNKLHRITTYQKQHHLIVEFTNKHFEKRFSVLLNRLIESGFPDKLTNDILYPKGLPLTSRTLSDLVGYFYPFSITHMRSAFVLYFIGLGASLFIFLMEVIVHSSPLWYRGNNAASISVRGNNSSPARTG